MKSTGAIIASTCIATALVVGLYYQQKIDLYKVRLRETLDHIHDLQHEIDPTHSKFTHGDHANHETEMNKHAHGMLDISETDWQPSVDVDMKKDAVSGWNVQILTTDFTFSPENASAEHVVGEGHAHIYVNGKKIARFYGDWFHLPAQPPGEHVLRVTLNTNNHQSLLRDGKPVEVEQVFTEE